MIGSGLTCIRCGNYTFEIFICGNSLDICCYECGEGQGLFEVRYP